MRVPSKYQDLPPGVAHRQEIAERWAQGCVWQAPFSFLQAQRGRHCPLSFWTRRPGTIPKGTRKGENIPRTKNAAPGSSKMPPHCQTLSCFVFVFFFFFGWDFWEQSQQLTLLSFNPLSLCIQISRTSTVIQDRGLNILHITPGPHWIHRDNCP